jgi:hypothetical protein
MTTATATHPVPVRRRAATPRWWADAAGAAGWLSLLVVTALWVRNSGVQQTTGGGWTAVAAIGRLAGLYAADLMLCRSCCWPGSRSWNAPSGRIDSPAGTAGPASPRST